MAEDRRYTTLQSSVRMETGNIYYKREREEESLENVRSETTVTRLHGLTVLLHGTQGTTHKYN